MKPVIAFIIALSVAPFVFAQEESPAPSGDEKASATVEESPAEATTSTPEATAPSMTAETPAAKKKEPTTASPAASTTAKSATATTAKSTSATQKPAAAATTAAKPGKKMSVEAALKDNENRWEAAVMSHDSKVAESLVANDFQGVYWDGKVLSKSGLIGMGKKDKDTYKSAVNEKLSVRSYGANVSVVVGTAHEKGTGKDGKGFDHVYRFTDTWVDRGGNWMCVASQIMKVK